MTPRHSPFLGPLLLAATITATAAVADDSPADPRPVSTLLTALADSDPAVRKAARDQLISRGRAAREEVLRATKSSVPAIAEGAADVLLQLPWTHPGEPARIRRHLQGYGALGPEERADVLATLARGDTAIAVRIATEDPAPYVAWSLAWKLAGYPPFQTEISERDPDGFVPAFRYARLIQSLRTKPEYPFTHERLREAERAWADMLAASLEAAPMVAELRQKLLADARWRADHARALRLLRTTTGGEVFTSADDDEVASENPLLSYHAAHGPLPGLSEDLATADPVLATATLARVAERADAPLLAAVCWQALDLQANGLDVDERGARFLRLGRWLRSAGDYRGAVRALAQIDAMNLPADADDVRVSIADRYNIALLFDDDRLAIDMLEKLQQFGVPRRDSPIDEELFWRRWRLERGKPNATIDGATIARVKEFATSDVNCAIDVIPWLDAQGRGAEAQAVFDQHLTALRGEAPPDNAGGNANAYNNIAWLCSRSRRNLDEALALQKKALVLAPTNAAYVDTMADIEGARRNYDAALQWETIALRLRPGMPFFEEQLFRFRAAGGK
jgi:tetratricopeptide (TPR) repeat protein